jgi:hypothetical protein
VIGTVEAITDWEGAPGLGRRVTWPDGTVGTYRWGAHGCYDLLHIETLSAARGGGIRKRHPLPETLEDSAARAGFGGAARYGVLLRVRPRPGCTMNSDAPAVAVGTLPEGPFDGVLEWPDFAAAARVEAAVHADGSVVITERELVWGCSDSGWLLRFGDHR